MKLLRDLLEATKKKTDTEAKSKADVKDKPRNINPDIFAEPKSKGSLTNQEKTKSKTTTSSSAKHKTAGAEKTRERMRGVNMHPDAAHHLANMDTTDLDLDSEISDEEAAVHAGHSAHSAANTHTPTDTPGIRPQPVTPNMLPAVISKALTTMGKNVANIEPEWHMVKHLPGYMARQIRALGRKVFEPFTRTPIEDIQVLADLGGGPNTEAEINAVSKYVSGHGKKNTSAELLFHRVLPEYSAKTVIYNCDGFTFMLVKDFAGNYIYSWPEQDNKELHGTMPKGIEHDDHQRHEHGEVRAIAHKHEPRRLPMSQPDWDNMD